PVRAGPGYSQQEAHVGRGVGCGLGGREASGWRRRRRPGKEKKKEERMRRRGAPAARRPQLFQWLAEGAEVGSTRLESLSGRRRKKGRGKGHSPPAQRTTTATAALLPRHFVSSPSLPRLREGFYNHKENDSSHLFIG
ncbi:hypothetical protein E2I00_006951, partial [Balaenoptera physalus]